MKPLLSIWTSPVKTFEFLSKRDDSTNRTMVNILSAMITIGAVFPQLKDLSEPFGNNKIIGILIGITLSGLIGIIIVRFLLVLIYWGVGVSLSFLVLWFFQEGTNSLRNGPGTTGSWECGSKEVLCRCVSHQPAD